MGVAGANVDRLWPERAWVTTVGHDLQDEAIPRRAAVPARHSRTLEEQYSWLRYVREQGGGQDYSRTAARWPAGVRGRCQPAPACLQSRICLVIRKRRFAPRPISPDRSNVPPNGLAPLPTA